jgi:hypothetical protein
MKPECQIDGLGTKRWRLKNGEYHREDGPAIEYVDGSKHWIIYGEYHRENGPAIECPDGSKFWYLNNILHREDGPALELYNGYKEWWLNGKEYTEKDYYKKRYNLGKISYDDYVLEMI